MTALCVFAVETAISFLTFVSDMSRIFRMMSYHTPEHYNLKACDAIVRNDVQELKRLLDKNLDANFPSKMTLYYLLPDVQFRRMIENYVISDSLTLKPLHMSILLKNKVVADLLLAHGADPRAGVLRQHGGSPPVCAPIHLTVIGNDCAILKSLIDRAAGNANLLNERDVYDLTALDQALRRGAGDCAQLLIQAGAAIATDENNASLLTVCGLISEACGKRGFAILNLILDVGYSGGGDILSAFLIHMTIDDDNEEAIHIFDKIVARYDFTAESRSGPERSNYMHLAAGQHCVRILQKLSALSATPETNLCGENPLHFAVRADLNTKQCIQYLLSLGCDMDQADASGCTPLLLAMECDNMNAILCLLDAGCACPISSQGYTYLHMYCNSGATDLSVLRKLVQKCDVNAVTKFNWTALHLLVNRCHPDNQQLVIVAMNELMRLGADPVVQNSAGDTILTLAVVRGLSEIICELMSPAFDNRPFLTLLRAADTSGLTPLHIAILNPSISKNTVIDLISKGADVNARDNDGRTTLFFLLATDYASHQSEGMSIGLVVTPENDPVLRFKNVMRRRNIFSCPIYGLTDRRKMWTILDHMLSNTDVDMNCRLTKTKDTPLNIAFARGEYVLMKKLLLSGADVTKLNGSKFTLQSGMLPMCKFLDQRGFDDFDPILFKLRDVQDDKYRMLMASAMERREIWDLDEFLEARKKKVPELKRMTGESEERTDV